MPADLAFDEHGAVAPELFIRNEIQPQVARAATASPRQGTATDGMPCDGVTVYEDFGRSSPATTLQALSRESSEVDLGTVVETVPGFFEGIPATLLGVRVGSSREVFVLYPAARFTVARRAFCRTDGRYPAVIPSVGDQVFLFAPKPSNTAGDLFVPAPYQLIVQRAGSEPQFAPELRDEVTGKGIRSLAQLKAHADRLRTEVQK